ncbi:TPA: phenylacetate--CoA ligase family protein [Candidatus Woesearchaeota archaeon]|nr:phenylacetate--CoA ligase family protein [Candidatus Woesearchaeota archaeon]
MFLRELYYLYKIFNQDRFSNRKKRGLQFFFLKNIVDHAYRNNQFYREFYSKKKFHPDMLRTIEDIKKIPCVDKSALLKNYRKLIDRKKMKDYKVTYTSGTTGEEFSVYLDDEANDYNNAIFIRTLMDQGYTPFRKLGFYWYREESNSFFNKFGISRKVIIRQDSNPEKQVEIIRKHKIKYLYYFPFKLLELANSFDEKHLRSLKLRRIFCIGEVLTEKMRAYFEKRFGCPVSDNYGLTEFNIAAYRKPGMTYYKTNWDSVVLEFEDTRKPGIKRPVITSLSNYFMPLIRYRTDDLVMAENSRIKRILGRESDFIKAGKKEVYLGDMVDKMLDFQTVKLFTFKCSGNRLTINILPKQVHDKEINGEIKEAFMKLAFKKVSVTINKKIGFSERGKLKLLDMV